ncbi:MAG: pro-sigmaK processing inhibitor BofA family protein [Candidatus Methanoperedens sp.]|jgi:hypothetical protein|nr:pro-sigmaK processing inhibitor BofA family protein [Candidatus Methanoperedens sp.]PKL53772.1 MAG: transcriptional regulator [Candidatus Methanoperedenaceae archaeon HGW-Methanoperedenaceae-1]
MLDIIILLAAVLAVIAVYYFLKTVKHLIVNTVLGLIILALSKFVFGMGIKITTTVILISAIGGVPGALLVILLHLMGVAF